ncbi:MAG TPA: 2-isopropylmalate synthase, partial [Thermoanaerobaculia bacterium]|nr:2-isopropylmalate synthase [Thermoanaerobaculia bacterium]
EWLSNLVYSGVPAHLIGRKQEIEVGPMSGNSNVVCYLRERGLEPTPSVVAAVLQVAKQSNRVLTEQEILEAARADRGAEAATSPRG